MSAAEASSREAHAYNLLNGARKSLTPETDLMSIGRSSHQPISKSTPCNELLRCNTVVGRSKILQKSKKLISTYENTPINANISFIRQLWFMLDDDLRAFMGLLTLMEKIVKNILNIFRILHEIIIESFKPVLFAHYNQTSVFTQAT